MITYLRVSPVNRSFSTISEKKAGPVIDLGVDTSTGLLMNAVIRHAGCEGVDSQRLTLTFSDFISQGSRVYASTVQAVSRKKKRVFHVASIAPMGVAQ